MNGITTIPRKREPYEFTHLVDELVFDSARLLAGHQLLSNVHPDHNAEPAKQPRADGL